MPRDNLPLRRRRLVESIKKNNLGITEQKEIFGILRSEGLQHTKNVNGNFFDITNLAEPVVVKLERFIEFFVKNNTLLETGHYTAPASNDAEPPPPSPADPAPSPSPEEITQTNLIDNLSRARTETISVKRKEACRYQQLKKKYSKPMARSASVPDVLQYEQA